jgi:hypothetical protein
MKKIILLSAGNEAHYFKNPTRLETIGPNALPFGIFTEYDVVIKNDTALQGSFKVFQNISGNWLDYSSGCCEEHLIKEFKSACELTEIAEAKELYRRED